MSTVEITFTGLFLVVPDGDDFTILLPRSTAHPHEHPEVGRSGSHITGKDIDLTAVLPRGGLNLPPHVTVPVTTLSGNKPIKPHLLEDAFPAADVKARIKVPKPARISSIGKAKWKMKTDLKHASNKLVFEYDGFAASTITIPTSTGSVDINESGEMIRIEFIHRAVTEPKCIPNLRALHVDAYYDLIEDPAERPIPELADDCPAALTVLELADEIASGVKGSKSLSIRRQVRAAIAKEKKSLSTFTCLVGSGT
jgi:hypothetical protein